MACEWWFYHLERPPLAGALAPLFEKCLERNWRVLVSSPDASQLSQIDSELWKWREESFLPHGLEGEHSARQPVLLSGGLANANKASVLVLLKGQEVETPSVDYQRVMVVFEDADGIARGKAREQFRDARKAGLAVRYFQQSASGGWVENTA